LSTQSRIVAFMCNWCSYAGADLAGTSRIAYPTNIRPIRVMCSGRVNPSHVLEALELGADGVLVSGCHPGDCHYISGNEKAQKKMEMTSKLLSMLGVGSDRLRLEWISASEGERFAEVAKSFTQNLSKIGPSPLEPHPSGLPHASSQVIEEAISATNVRQCLDCGKCSSSCPVARINDEYSPRRVVDRFLLGMGEKMVSSREMWMCTGCYLCRERCPSDVRFAEFLAKVRSLADPETKDELCAHGGLPLSISRIMTTPGLNQKRMAWLPAEAKVAEKGDLLYFVGCLPYFDVIFEDIDPNTVSIAQNAVRLLNHLGENPVVMKNERCCGHDLLWTGDYESFRRLAEMNVEEIRASGAKKVVTTCAECYRTIAKDYPEAVGELGFEVVHFSQHLADLMEKNKLEFKKPLNKRIVYHDPCRLGRHMGVYDAPRRVLQSILGVELLEMENNREAARCCGVSSWLACSKYTKELQRERLVEAKETGADLLVTACPKCQIHWKCILSEKSEVRPTGIDIEFSDLATVAANGTELRRR